MKRIVKKKINIAELMQRYGEFLLNDYLDVVNAWTKSQKKALIESIQIGFPLNPFWVMDYGEFYVVLDGNSRMETLREFYNDGYMSLNIKERRRFMETELDFIIIEIHDEKDAHETRNWFEKHYRN